MRHLTTINTRSVQTIQRDRGVPLFTINGNSVLRLLSIRRVVPSRLMIKRSTNLNRTGTIRPTKMIQINNFTQFLKHNMRSINNIRTTNARTRRSTIMIIRRPQRTRLDGGIILNKRIPTTRRRGTTLKRGEASLLNVTNVTKSRHHRKRINIHGTLNGRPTRLIILLMNVKIYHGNGTRRNIVQPSNPRIHRGIITNIRRQGVQPQLGKTTTKTTNRGRYRGSSSWGIGGNYIRFGAVLLPTTRPRSPGGSPTFHHFTRDEKSCRTLQW